MGERGLSRTAQIVALLRGRHRLLSPQPWILDDPYALGLIGPAWPAIADAIDNVFEPRLLGDAVGSMVVRARYAEDRLIAGDFAQYVVLGAGLDSFGWRRPDILRSVVVYELDEAATQDHKRARAADLALPSHANHRLVAVDFESQSVAEALEGAGFDWGARTLFSWLGVTMYLTTDAIETTLRTVTRCAPGSEIVLTYLAPESHRDDVGNELVGLFGRAADATAEPLRTFLAPAEADELLMRCGLAVAEHPTPRDLEVRYFDARTDGLRPGTADRVVAGAVPGLGTLETSDG